MPNLDQSVSTRPDDYKGFILYTIATVDNPATVTVIDKPDGKYSLCVQRHTRLSNKIQDLEVKISTDIENFLTKRPSVQEVLTNILKDNEVTDIQSNPPNLQCWPVFAKPYANLDFPQVLYIQDEDSFFEASQKSRELMSNALVFQKALSQINQVMLQSTNQILYPCQELENQTTSSTIMLVIASLIITVLSLITLTVCLCIKYCKCCKSTCIKPNYASRTSRSRRLPTERSESRRLPNAPIYE